MRGARIWLASVSLLALCSSSVPSTRAQPVARPLEPLQLSQKDFEATLQNLDPGKGVLMEFYAHWCDTVMLVS